MNKTIKEKDKQIRNLEMSVAKLEIENGELHTKNAMSLDSEASRLNTSTISDDNITN